MGVNRTSQDGYRATPRNVCRRPWRFLAAVCICISLGCDAPIEADRVYLPVRVDASELVEITTDLGYRITLRSAHIALRDIVFHVQGEEHVATHRPSLWNWLISTAYAHPGHFEGGVVTGELLGQFTTNWLDTNTPTLGEATLLPGRYRSFSFTFDQAERGLDERDPMLEGHTAILEGTASRDNQDIPFTIIIDSPTGRILADAPADLSITTSTNGVLYFQLLIQSPLTNATLFDGIDFQAYSAAGNAPVTIQPGAPETEGAYHTMVRAFQSLDFYRIHHAN